MKKLLFAISFLISTLITSCVPALAQSEKQIDAFSGTSTGQNTYSVSIPAITIPTYDGQKIWVKFSIINTGASTLRVNTYTARAITLNGSALTAGQIIANQYVGLVYSSTATSWQIQSPSVATVIPANTYWETDGNTGTTAGTNFVGTTDNVSLRFRTNNTQKVIFDSVGNVGIGITLPTAKLHVASTGSTSATFAFKLDDVNGDSLFKVRSDGWIGAGDDEWRNLTIGFEGGWVTQDGNNLRNVFLGTKCAKTMKSGSDNCIIGSIAMWQADTCVSNTAVGTEALYSLTKANYNTIMGKQSGFSLTTGSNNTFLGYESGIALTTQSNNTAVGYLSLDESTTGQNDAFGSESLGENATGTGNIGLGQNTLGLNVSGNYNTSVGVNSGFSCKGAGTSNVYVGYNAGYNNFSGADGGSRNVFVGESAGQENTGSGNIFIGYRSGQSSQFDAVSNTLLLDNEDTNTPWLWGDFSVGAASFNALVGIGTGTVTPTTSLEINGGLTIDPLATQTLTAASTTVTVGNESYIQVTSDDATPANRLLVLPQSTSAGQILIIEFVGATNALKITDDAAQGTGGNMRLAGDMDMNQYDTITLISNGTDWIETSRSVN